MMEREKHTFRCVCVRDVLTRIWAMGPGWPNGFNTSWKQCERTKMKATCIPIVETGLNISRLHATRFVASILLLLSPNYPITRKITLTRNLFLQISTYVIYLRNYRESLRKRVRMGGEGTVRERSMRKPFSLLCSWPSCESFSPYISSSLSCFHWWKWQSEKGGEEGLGVLLNLAFSMALFRDGGPCLADVVRERR